MKNPFKRITTFFNKKPVGSVDPSSADYKQLKRVWPEGTWQMAGTRVTDRKDYDVTVRGILFDTWWLESFGGDMKAFKTRNPAMMGLPDPIPATWQPSERIFKDIAIEKSYDTKMVHYIVGELSNLKHLRP